MSGRTITLRLTVAEADLLIHLVLEDHKEHAHGATRRAYLTRLARLRHGHGIANLLQVLSAEDAALANQRALAELKARAFLLDVTLVRALGGGFTAPAADTEQTDR